MDRDFITAPQLLFVLKKIYPQLENMKDYWVGQPTDGLGGPQIEDARVYDWKSSLPEPDSDELIATAVKLLPEYNIYQEMLETQTVFKAYAIRSRFTSSELLKIKTASANDPSVGLINDLLNSGSPIDVTKASFQTDVDALVSKGLIEASRKSKILETVRTKWN